MNLFDSALIVIGVAGIVSAVLVVMAMASYYLEGLLRKNRRNKRWPF